MSSSSTKQRRQRSGKLPAGEGGGEGVAEGLGQAVEGREGGSGEVGQGLVGEEEGETVKEVKHEPEFDDEDVEEDDNDVKLISNLMLEIKVADDTPSHSISPFTNDNASYCVFPLIYRITTTLSIHPLLTYRVTPSFISSVQSQSCNAINPPPPPPGLQRTR